MFLSIASSIGPESPETPGSRETSGLEESSFATGRGVPLDSWSFWTNSFTWGVGSMGGLFSAILVAAEV
ncbi:hypothetical protein [Thermofilum sp.]|uniref:hypothetical protein n=1 Tax=Thermofilum sp. TaxID=1961369 RepID=UPI00316288F7